MHIVSQAYGDSYWREEARWFDWVALSAEKREKFGFEMHWAILARHSALLGRLFHRSGRLVWNSKEWKCEWKAGKNFLLSLGWGGVPVVLRSCCNDMDLVRADECNDWSQGACWVISYSVLQCLDRSSVLLLVLQRSWMRWSFLAVVHIIVIVCAITLGLFCSFLSI